MLVEARLWPDIFVGVTLLGRPRSHIRDATTRRNRAE